MELSRRVGGFVKASGDGRSMRLWDLPVLHSHPNPSASIEGRECVLEDGYNVSGKHICDTIGSHTLTEPPGLGYDVRKISGLETKGPEEQYQEVYEACEHRQVACNGAERKLLEVGVKHNRATVGAVYIHEGSQLDRVPHQQLTHSMRRKSADKSRLCPKGPHARFRHEGLRHDVTK